MSDPGPEAPDSAKKKNLVSRIMGWLEEAILAVWRFIGAFLRDPIGQTEKFFAWIYSWAKDPYRLRIYGTSLLTDEVRHTQFVYAVVLTAVYAFEMFAWHALWGYTGVAPWLVNVLTLVFATIIVMLDRSILVMPATRGWKMAGVVVARLTMLGFLSFITAIPAELEVFEPEIEEIFLAEEAEKAKALRKEKVDETLALAKEQAAAVATASVNSDQVQSTQRVAEKKLLMDRQDKARAAIVKRQSSAQRKLDRELGKSAKDRDEGDVRAYRANLKTIDGELAAHDAKAAAELESFDKRSEELAEKARIAATTTAKEQGETVKGDVVAVGTKSNEELAAEMKGTVKVARGLVARIVALFQVTEGSTLNQVISWSIRVVMIILGLSVLFLKFLMKSIATSAYYSIRSQAANGDEMAASQIRARAEEDDPEAATALCYAAVSDTREENLRIVRALALGRMPLAIKAMCLRAERGSIVSSEDVTVVHALAQARVPRAIKAVCCRVETLGTPTDLALVRTLAKEREGEALRVVMNRARSSGPGNGEDRAIAFSLGLNPDEKLAFQSPEVTTASIAVSEANKALQDALVAFRTEMEDFCQGRAIGQDEKPEPRPNTRRAINARARKVWNEMVEPKMRNRAGAVTNLRMLGGTVPGWSPSYTEKDPLDSSELRLWDEDAVTELTLIESFGWERPDRSIHAIGS